MVSPKTVCDHGGDKSPSPEPFKEPEGLVTIELQSSKNFEAVKKNVKQPDKRKKLVLKILLAIFFLNITVFAVVLYINEEPYFFKTKPIEVHNTENPHPLNKKQISITSIEELIDQCVSTRPLKICCVLFGDTNVQFFNYCFNNNILLPEIDIDIRKRRDLTEQIPQTYDPNLYHTAYLPETYNYENYDDPIHHYNNYEYFPEYSYDQQYPKIYDTHIKPAEENIVPIDTVINNRNLDTAEGKTFEIKTELPNNVKVIKQENIDQNNLPSTHLNRIKGTFSEAQNKDNGKFKPVLSILNDDQPIKHSGKSPEMGQSKIPVSLNESFKKTEGSQKVAHLKLDASKNEDAFNNKENSDSFLKIDHPKSPITPNDLLINPDSTQEAANFEHEKKLQKVDQPEKSEIPNNSFKKPDASQKATDLEIDASRNQDIFKNKENSEIPTDSVKKADGAQTAANLEPDITKNESDIKNMQSKDSSPTVVQPEKPEIPENSSRKPDTSQRAEIVSLPKIKTNNEQDDAILSINIPLSNNDYAENSYSNEGNDRYQNKVKNGHEETIKIFRDQTDTEDHRTRQKLNLATASVDMQSSQQTMFNPCFNQYPYAGQDNNQVLRIVPQSAPRFSQFFVNPPVYPYMQNPYMGQQQFLNQQMQQMPQVQNGPLQVTGPGGQFYICNPISSPNNNVMSNNNNIASLPGVEVRREAANLQDLVGNAKVEKPSDKSRAADITCPAGQEACADGSKCISKFHICDNDAQCSDGSDEEFCTCKQRVGNLRACDGYFDCPDGDDELGCFGCDVDEFSCDDWSKSRKSTCIPKEQRCDNVVHCEITGKDEEDCSVLADNIGSQPYNKISNSVGFLHRNYKGKWYPTCFGNDEWAMDVCKVESGPTAVIPKNHMVLTVDKYDGFFINSLPDKQVSLVKTCVQDRATFIECPPMYCGMRISVKNPYRKHEVDISAENIIEDLERVASMSKNDEEFVGGSRIVGGKPSQPASWPWLVSIYKNGNFHCGGVLISELWVVTASHCIDRYWQFYYEIQAGSLRRFSFAPMEQNRWASVVIANIKYDRMTLKHDIALMKLSSPVRFNRYVRPICLPTESTAGRDFAAGPSPGTICTTVGWGATMEHGADPDHMREVEVPVLEHCKHKDDFGEDEICAGLAEGGKDACQGDSGGPLICRNPNNPSQWYLAGVVSHGEGCARPDEPGVYAKVAKYMGWIVENMAEDKFIPRFPLQKCPGYTCKLTNRCVSKKHRCDTVVDCLLGDDELDCKSHQNNFLMFRNSEGDKDVESRLRATLVDTNSSSVEQTEAHKSVDVVDVNGQPTSYFRCKSLLQLVPISKECNKIVDCEDGTDEEGCQCADYVKNRNPNAICDGITDCYDLTDENCLKCKRDEYHCRQSQKCIELSKRCDGISDCDRNEDEWDCVALTNGETLTFDSDLRPKLAMSGIITINKNGIWKPLCQNTTEKAATIVSNACYLLGFEEYMGFHERQVQDKPFNAAEDNSGNKTCNGLYIKCSNISLDSSIHSVHLDNDTDEVELYTSPWNAAIYSDGIYRCMGAVINSRWIMTSIDCCDGINMLNKHYVTVLLGKGKATLHVKGPHEQTLKIVESVKISDTDIILLRTETNIAFSRYIKDVRLSVRRDGRRKEKCVAIGMYNNRAKFEFLSPIENCLPGFRCFETNLKTNCTGSSPWSGNIFCDSGNGWYVAAVFSEKNGLCGLSSVVQYTSVPFNKNYIFKAMEKTSLNIDGPECSGFRCALGECITKNQTCNGIEDCRGGEDEESTLCYENEHACHLTGECACRRTELKCKTKTCIPKSKFCDRNDDCGDLSDEPNVCDCRAYLELTSPDKVCDGIVNCADRSDEDPQKCPCLSSGFRCISTDDCIANDMICDGFEDCPNGEDEKVCLNIVNEKNESSNAGELIRRTAGIWHSGCFNRTVSAQELNKICFDMGFKGNASNQIPPPKNTELIAHRPVMDHFDIVWIRREVNNKFKLALRIANEPYVKFVPDESCYKLFLACL